jgi:hypothetical protein
MNADSKDNTRGCHSRERGNPRFLATTESTEPTENEPAPECHCEARRAAALRAEGDAAISTTAKDINLQNKTYLTTEDTEAEPLNPRKLPSFSVPSVVTSCSDFKLQT